jgi:serine/threonine protein kinase
MFHNKSLNKELKLLEKIGSGSFGSVFTCDTVNNDRLAIKCEEKKNNNDTLFKEFKFCGRFYNIKKYLNSNGEFMKDKDYIKIFEYIVKNDILTVPSIFSLNLLKDYKIVPHPYTFYSSDEYNFLTMDLCGDNFEQILDNHTLTESCKYYIAYKLLHMMSCFHRCGVIHRDMKLANLVLNKKIENVKNFDELDLVLIDLGLAKEFYKYEGEKVIPIKPTASKSITGTIRYISLNIHELNTPTIIDDLISMCYMLVNIFTEKSLPWVGHKKDENKFDRSKHTITNCKCGYHKNKEAGKTKGKNTIAQIKFHTPLDDLCGNYIFIKKWLSYLYSMNLKQMPSYNIMLNILNEHNKNNNLKLEFIEKIKNV